MQHSHRGAARAVLLTTLSAVALATSALPARAADDRTKEVNPFIGTQDFGTTFPGPSVPFGMVQPSPDNGGAGGYDYERGYVDGFSQTHLSGVGCGALGELPLMPTTGPVTGTTAEDVRSPIDHATETASPGAYDVDLERWKTHVALAATQRVALHRYTFPATGQANVVLPTGRANMGVKASHVEVVGDDTVEGWVRAGGFCAGHDEHVQFFSARFDRPFARTGTFKGDQLTPGGRRSDEAAGENGAWVTFDATQQRDVTVEVGLSYTGVEGARANREAETKDTGFDLAPVRAAADRSWEAMLAKATISGGSADRRVAYYTALYHALLHPNTVGDVDGAYRGGDGEVHRATDHTPMGNLSLWDTYRPQNQLLELLTPDVARDVALSILDVHRDAGWLPRWSLANSETNVMTGDAVTPFLVENWSKGLLAGHEEEAYEALLQNSQGTPPAGDTQFNGRLGNPWYQPRGYIPAGVECPDKGGDPDCNNSASSTLEYAAGDGALALMARGLGHRADARRLEQQSQSYRQLWDRRIGSFRSRESDGVWTEPFDTATGEGQFQEGGPTQYQWLVPQDPAGMIRLLGGRDAATKRLDGFFAYDDLLADPERTARERWVTGAFDYYGRTTYNPNNEPDLLAPYTYAWTGQPAKTATVIAAAHTLFTNAPDGVTGNDDLGAMSAWYVLSSLGIFPTMSGSGFSVLSTPQFERADVALPNGRSLTITAPGASASRRYIASARHNGRSIDRTWLTDAAIRRGGLLDYTLADQPTDWGTRPGAAPPSVMGDVRPQRRDLAARLSPREAIVPPDAKEATPVELTMTLVGTAPGDLRARPRITAPRGWTVTATRRPVRLRSNGVPATRELPVTVRVPAGTRAGEYPLRLTVRGGGVAPVTGTATVRAVTGRCVGATDAGCPVDVGAERDVDGIATEAAPGEGDFDGLGNTFPGDLLPAAGPVTWDGVPYDAPPITGTAKNLVALEGQTIPLPAARYRQALVVGAARNGDVASAATVTYADGDSEALPLTIPDWAGDPPDGTPAVADLPYRLSPEGRDGIAVRLFRSTLTLDPSRAVRSITLPDDDRGALYALTLRP